MQASETPDVHFVDHGLMPRGAQQFIAFPIEAGISDYGLRHQWRAVALGKC